MSDREAYKVKCKNCTGVERHENYYWCDFWCTTIDDADTSYCSYFVPNKPIGDENNNVSKDK